MMSTMPASPDSLPEALKALRTQRSLTQQQLADQLGIASSFVTMIEGGKRSMSVETLEELIDTLQLTPAEAKRLHAARTKQSANLRVRRPRRGVSQPDGSESLEPDVAVQILARLDRIVDQMKELSVEQIRLASAYAELTKQLRQARRPPKSKDG